MGLLSRLLTCLGTGSSSSSLLIIIIEFLSVLMRAVAFSNLCPTAPSDNELTSVSAAEEQVSVSLDSESASCPFDAESGFVSFVSYVFLDADATCCLHQQSTNLVEGWTYCIIESQAVLS
jgi:hypothetical protein